MELDLALTARRAVVSLSMRAEWLTLKTAIFMTTKRQMYARLLPVPRHLLHRPIQLTPGAVRKLTCFLTRTGGMQHLQPRHSHPAEHLGCLVRVLVPGVWQYA